MQFMIFDLLDSHWLKRSKADMQSYFGNLDAARPNAVHDLGSEVQARRGRSYRAAFACIYRLVALMVGGAIFTIDIRRQRHMTNAIDTGKKIFNRREANPTLTKFAAFDDLR